MKNCYFTKNTINLFYLTLFILNFISHLAFTTDDNILVLTISEQKGKRKRENDDFLDGSNKQNKLANKDETTSPPIPQQMSYEYIRQRITPEFWNMTDIKIYLSNFLF